MFAAALVFLIGLMAIVVDVTWYWAKTLQVQRAADAAALAGAVLLPDCPDAAHGSPCVAHNAYDTALASAAQNGYTNGVGQVTVTAVQNPDRPIQLDTTVSAPVSSFFMLLFGINTLQATRSAAAEYALPLPMGSPLNYFGAFGKLRGGWIYKDTGWLAPTSTLTSAPFNVPDKWNNPSAAYIDEAPSPASYATTPNSTDFQGFATFRLPNSTVAGFGMPANASARFVTYGGIEVMVKAKSSVASGCQLQADVTSDAGVTWSGPGKATNDPATLTNATPDTVITFGGSASTGATDATDWWRTTGWSASNFADGSFAVRLKAVGTCGTTSVDYIKVRVTYEEMEPLITGPNGESPLTKQGIWGAVMSQGADVISGDIYSPQKNSGASSQTCPGSPGTCTNSQYSPTSYYDYAVEMEPGTTNGSVYIYDPVFCATNGNSAQGIGDHWISGGGAMNTFYYLYDTMNTPYDLTDDGAPIASSGNLFSQSNRTDSTQGGPSQNPTPSNCQRGVITDPANGGYWHNRWWTLATGIAGPPAGSTLPRVYRIRVTSTQPTGGTSDTGTNAENDFALFSTVAGHTCPSTPFDALCPRVYGLGSMVAFTPLDSGQVADLYLSQISAVYAGKTIKVSLWDPGDTGNLSAKLSFLQPTSSGYSPIAFTWTASKFAASSTSTCDGKSGASQGGAGVETLTTNTGGSSLFNGCWVIISITIPSTYSAPTPTGEPGPGWWKIRYAMGSEGGTAADTTTWKTQIIGNPVHLVLP